MGKKMKVREKSGNLDTLSEHTKMSYQELREVSLWSGES